MTLPLFSAQRTTARKKIKIMKKNMNPRKSKDFKGGRLFELALGLAKDISLEELYEKTRLPISWLRKFLAGAIKGPSVHRVEKIIVKLTGKELA